MKKYRLVREDYDGTQKTVSQSNNIHYLNKRMRDLWWAVLEKCRETNVDTVGNFFVNEYAKLSGVAVWMILENNQA